MLVNLIKRHRCVHRDIFLERYEKLTLNFGLISDYERLTGHLYRNFYSPGFVKALHIYPPGNTIGITLGKHVPSRFSCSCAHPLTSKCQNVRAKEEATSGEEDCGVGRVLCRVPHAGGFGYHPAKMSVPRAQIGG